MHTCRGGCICCIDQYAEETLENRKKRNRDTAIDSPFVARVLRIEQKKINDGLDRADIIQDMHGRIYTE